MKRCLKRLVSREFNIWKNTKDTDASQPVGKVCLDQDKRCLFWERSLLPLLPLLRLD